MVWEIVPCEIRVNSVSSGTFFSAIMFKGLDA